MEERRRYQATAHLGAGFFQNLSAGYFFALPLSPTPLGIDKQPDILYINLIRCVCLRATVAQ